jgi:hypothetical protein
MATNSTGFAVEALRDNLPWTVVSARVSTKEQAQELLLMYNDPAVEYRVYEQMKGHQNAN